MNLSLKLLAAVAATTMGAAALTVTTTTPAEAVGLGTSCREAGGTQWYVNDDSWECVVPVSLSETAEPALQALCAYDFYGIDYGTDHLDYICDYGT